MFIEMNINQVCLTLELIMYKFRVSLGFYLLLMRRRYGNEVLMRYRNLLILIFASAFLLAMSA